MRDNFCAVIQSASSVSLVGFGEALTIERKEKEKRKDRKAIKIEIEQIDR